MELNNLQKRDLFLNGYLHIPGVVPQVMVQQALKVINNSLGEGIDPAQITKFRAQTYCPELTGTADIADIFNRTPALQLAESAIGENALRPVHSAQIALRFPTLSMPPPPPRPHIDGTYSPTNGVQEGTLSSFTALVGILLSPLTADYQGNFTVWPGSHILLQKYCEQNDPRTLIKGLPNLNLPPPVQVTGMPGDMLLVHHMLAHTAAPNASHNVRYALFFRLKREDHDEHKWEILTNPWLQWHGMQQTVEETGVA